MAATTCTTNSPARHLDRMASTSYICVDTLPYLFTRTHPIRNPVMRISIHVHSPIHRFNNILQTRTFYINRTQRVSIHWHAFEPFFIFSYNIVEHRPFHLKKNNAISAVIPVIVAIRWTSVNMFSCSSLMPAIPREHDDDNDNDNIIIYRPWFHTKINEIIWGRDRFCLRRNDFIDLSHSPYTIKGVFHQAYRVSFIVFEVFCGTRVRAMN